MTEQDWLASEDPERMLSSLDEGLPTASGYDMGHGLGGQKFSDRKLRLFACGCARQVWHLLTDERSRRAVEVAERYADGAATSKERGLVFNAADGLRGDQQSIAYGCLRANAADGAIEACFHARQCGASAADLAATLRDIVGNPWRPVEIAPDCYECHGRGRWAQGYQPDFECPECDGTGKRPCPWLTPTVLSLAQAAYDERPDAECEECMGRGGFDWYPEDDPSNSRMEGPVWTNCRADCKGGRTTDGRLDPVRLAVLADALEEAGCVGGREWLCMMQGKHSHPGRAGQVIHGVLHDFNPNVLHHHHDEKCPRYNHPHPLLAHLRSEGPHVRGCWALSLILGQD